MNKNNSTSKFISLILRHKPEVIGITLDEHGWANVVELLAGINRTRPLDMAGLEEIVRTDEKQRYAFNADKTKIRANQGHSVPVDVELQPVTPPTLLWWWPRWEWEKAGSSRAPWGTYVAKDGAEAVCARRILGSQQYRDNKRRYWTLAQDRLSLSCTDGRIIRYNDSDRVWVLGVRGVGKWWESANGPDRESGMRLDPWKHDAERDDDVPDPDAEPVELSFDRFVASEGTDRIYMAEVALWR